MPFKNFCVLWFSRKSRNGKIVFVRPLHVSCMGWEVKIDMSGQSNSCLRVCNVKMKNFLPGQKQGTFLRIFRLRPVASSNLNYFFLKMLKLDEKESLDPQNE